MQYFQAHLGCGYERNKAGNTAQCSRNGRYSCREKHERDLLGGIRIDGVIGHGSRPGRRRAGSPTCGSVLCLPSLQATVTRVRSPNPERNCADKRVRTSRGGGRFELPALQWSIRIEAEVSSTSRERSLAVKACTKPYKGSTLGKHRYERKRDDLLKGKATPSVQHRTADSNQVDQEFIDH